MDVASAATTYAAQSAASVRSSFGAAVARQALDTVETLLAPPAPGTGTLVDKPA